MLKRFWHRFWKPAATISFGAIALVSFALGIVFWGGFHWSVELSNTETFCIACHEMRDTVFEELKETAHYNNPSGVRATCADCHVPKQWHHKMIRKVQATSDLYHTIVGTVDTPEKFEEERLRMARSVWSQMKATDSRECRNCHDINSMDIRGQATAARKKHERMLDEGQTCIDCHQGIAHELPDGWDEEDVASR